MAAGGESGRRRLIVNIVQPELLYTGETTVQTNARMVDSETGEMWRLRAAKAHIWGYNIASVTATTTFLSVYAEAMDGASADPILLFQMTDRIVKPEGVLAYPLALRYPLEWEPPLFMGLDVARPSVRFSLEAGSDDIVSCQLELYYSVVRTNYYEFQRVRKGS